jgi:hypothetical protein
MEALPENRRRKVRAMSEVPWFNPMVNEALAHRCAQGASSPAQITEALLRLTCIVGSMKQSIVDSEAGAVKRDEQIKMLIESGLAGHQAIAQPHATSRGTQLTRANLPSLAVLLPTSDIGCALHMCSKWDGARSCAWCMPHNAVCIGLHGVADAWEPTEVSRFEPMVNQALVYGCERGATSPAEITGAELRLTCVMGSLKQSIAEIESRSAKRFEQVMLAIGCASIDMIV